MYDYNELECFHDWVISSCELGSEFILTVYSETVDNINHELKIIFKNVTFIEYEIWDNKGTKIKDIKDINYRMAESWFLRAINDKNGFIHLTNVGGSDEFDETGGELSIKFENYKILDKEGHLLSIEDIDNLNSKRYE
jgi:hypothetical protein